MQTKKNHRLSVKGFTLVEMIVVLAIVGVLMAVIAPNLSSSIRDKKTVSACVNAEQVLMGVQNWLTEMEVQGVEVGDYTTRPDITTTKKFLMVQGFGTGYYQIVDYGTPEPEECSLSTTLTTEQRDLKKFLPRSKDNDTADFDKSWVASINLETYTVEYVCWKAE
ncbi:MAG: type II secretion system protein, partial [Oscillospiraceae bacterium]